MASAVMHRNGSSQNYYGTGNGQVTYSDSDAEMAVDCPPAYVAAHPPYPGTQPRNLETPPPTPLDGNLANQNKRTTKNLEDVAAVAATLPQPEMDFTRINRMRESVKRQKELRKRDQQVREEMSKDEGAEKIRRIKTLTSEDEPSRLAGFENEGFESDNLHRGANGTTQTNQSLQSSQQPSLEEMMSSLSAITSQINDPELLGELKFLQKMANKKDFKEAAELQQSVAHSTATTSNATPVHCNVQNIIKEVCEELAHKKNSDSRELVAVLSKPFMQSLVQAHDEVAKDTDMSSASINVQDSDIVQRASLYTQKPIQIVRINKSGDPLGATVRIDENDGRVLVSRIVSGGAADKSHLLNENDEILEVNGEPMRGKDVNSVGDLIAGMTGMLTFVIVPSETIPNGHVASGYQEEDREPVMHVRALYDYDAFDDPYLPCRELGLSFQKGDILHVMSQEDKDWWQAYREGDEDTLTLPGLVPSLNFQLQRETVRLSLEKKEPTPENEKSVICGKSKAKKKKNKKKVAKPPLEEEQIEVYEEMALYHQPEERKRPIVLIGPPNVGRHELRQKLVENDKNRFCTPVPHTTRAMNSDEIEGEEYHYVSQKTFEEMIESNKFIEHGSYLKNLYGTALSSVQKVINSGKICVLNLHAETLKLTKGSNLKPYIIFIAPPPLERLRQNMAKEGKQIKEDELRKIIESARDIEHNYAHYFDETIRNIDLSRSYAELLRLINKLDTEPQWVPYSWLD